MNDLADQLARLSPDEINALRAQGLDKAAAEEERQARVKMHDPHGTVRYLGRLGNNDPMFIVRRDDPDDEWPHWAIYIYERHGIYLEDGQFDPADAPVVGRIDE